MAIHRLKPEVYSYAFGMFDPVLTVRSGETVVAETRDAMGNDAQRNPLPPSMKQVIPGISLLESNPAVGPIYVENAEEGDLLAVHIEQIRLNRDFAFSRQGPNFGSLTGEAKGYRLLYNEPIREIWFEWKLDLERNTGILELPQSRLKKVEVALSPFIGSIGVAPRYGRVETTLSSGEFGGNMDCLETKAGSTIYLPVWASGAYLSFGDIHALQGDGEFNGTALEVTAEVSLRIEVLKDRRAEWPRLEDDTHVMVIGNARPLDDCVRLSLIGLLDWLVEEYGFQREEAWQLMAQVTTFRIGNVVDPKYTVVAKFPKQYLP